MGPYRHRLCSASRKSADIKIDTPSRSCAIEPNPMGGRAFCRWLLMAAPGPVRKTRGYRLTQQLSIRRDARHTPAEPFTVADGMLQQKGGSQIPLGAGRFNVGSRTAGGGFEGARHCEVLRPFRAAARPGRTAPGMRHSVRPA